MFGGFCAYCGVELNGKWHVDHVEAVQRETKFVEGKVNTQGFSVSRATGKLFRPENDRRDNLVPSCIKCNILKSSANVEGFREMLTYFVESIPRIPTYSHVHHLIRFEMVKFSAEPVVFWFEKFVASRSGAD